MFHLSSSPCSRAIEAQGNGWFPNQRDEPFVKSDGAGSMIPMLSGGGAAMNLTLYPEKPCAGSGKMLKCDTP